MRGFARGLVGMVGLSLVGSTLTVLQPWPVKAIIDGALIGRQVDLGWIHLDAATDTERVHALAILAGVYFTVLVTGVLANAAAFYMTVRVALHMIHTLRSQLVHHMRSLSLRFHASQSVGDSIWRAINDARSMQDLLLYGARTFTVPIFRLVLMVVLMAILDPVLTIVTLAIVPPLVWSVRLLTGRIQSSSAVSRARMADLTGLIEQNLVAIRAVQVFGQEASERERFDDTSMAFVRSQLRFRTWEQALNVITVALTAIGSTAILLLAGQRVINGSLTVGALWIFVSYMRDMYNMVSEVMRAYGPFQDAVVGVGRAFAVLDEEPEIREADDAVGKEAFTSDIAFSGVAFSYEPEQPVLQEIDLTVRRGEQIAIVGETGSGKTTLLSLIPRLYDVTEGAIEVDGIDVRRLTLASLRSLISAVPQEPLLFPASIRDNIRYGRFTASDDEIVAAARAARAHEFIRDLPSGYDTAAGERGVKLSSGQQQRISIARAFLKDAPILLLDEPTSALDLNTEADFLEGLEELMAGRTVFIVAHRLSTIRSVDRILVLDGGRIVEAGGHDELIAVGGHYHGLYTRQFGTAGRAASK
jgi:ATP-binding cassette subfamily B protein/subfamily B ATP-binding cassette protein MsbA